MSSEAFDPFNLSGADVIAAAVAPTHSPPPQIKTKVPSFNIKPQYVTQDNRPPPIVVLPKIGVNLKLHEEVTSKAMASMGEDGAVQLFVEGKVMVSITRRIIIQHIHAARCYNAPLTYSHTAPPFVGTRGIKHKQNSTILSSNNFPTIC